MTRSPIDIMIDQATGHVPEPVKPLTAQERTLLHDMRQLEAEAKALEPFRHPGDEQFAHACALAAFRQLNYLNPETFKAFSAYQRAGIRSQIERAIVDLLPRYRAAEAEDAADGENT